jgi:hypothetical protein
VNGNKYLLLVPIILAIIITPFAVVFATPLLLLLSYLFLSVMELGKLVSGSWDPKKWHIHDWDYQTSPSCFHRCCLKCGRHQERGSLDAFWTTIEKSENRIRA